MAKKKEKQFVRYKAHCPSCRLKWESNNLYEIPDSCEKCNSTPTINDCKTLRSGNYEYIAKHK